ncbi:MAG: sigma-54 dependent transcriptional regulator [bacterium]
MNNLNVLIIDDEESQIHSLKSFLARRNYNVYTAINGIEGIKIVNSNQIDAILTDFRMPELDGLGVLKNAKEINPEIDVVVMTAYGNIDDAVSIMKTGAYDYLTKPIDLDELENTLNRIREKKFLTDENKQLKELLKTKFSLEGIISQSKNMEEAVNTAARVASSKATVLILGESGTGKELIAKAIHYSSNRNDKPFITVNVASLSDNLIESELFGHEKGSFTGAATSRAGRFEDADNGTLFIDEVGDIPLQTQVKLLRTIQFGEVQRIGSNNTITVNVRIVAATHRNLDVMIKEGTFREDLYYRLNVITINIPPLRERKEDIPLLANYFLQKYSAVNQKEIKGITNAAIDKLMKFNYPGNIRELENIMERAVLLSRYEYIDAADLPTALLQITENKLLDPKNLEIDYESKVKAFEIEIVNEALKRTNGNQSAAARILQISERHLRSRLERLGLKNHNNNL